MNELQAAAIIDMLQLQPHPEGGHYRETFRDENPAGGRAFSTGIYFLLQEGERSHWHKVDALECWHWHAGAPLLLSLFDETNGRRDLALGPDLKTDERPQGLVPPHAWQAARSLGPWTLVGCTVAPGFEFEHFELAPPGWEPGHGPQDS